MEIVEYKGTKNDLVIGIVNRWTVSDIDKTVTITLHKVSKGFEISQWAMDSDGNDLEDYRMSTTPFKKKYYAMQEVIGMLKKYNPDYGKKKPYVKKPYRKK